MVSSLQGLQSRGYPALHLCSCPCSISSIIFCIMPSLRSIAISALNSAQLVLYFFNSGVSATPPTCLNPVLSCHNTTAENTCCFNFPGGQVLQTQFWDTDPATGPADSWTIHGLWCVVSNVSTSCKIPNGHSGLTIAMAHILNTVMRIVSTRTLRRFFCHMDEPLCSNTWIRTGKTMAGRTRASGNMSGASMAHVIAL